MRWDDMTRWERIGIVVTFIAIVPPLVALLVAVVPVHYVMMASPRYRAWHRAEMAKDESSRLAEARVLKRERKNDGGPDAVSRKPWTAPRDRLRPPDAARERGSRVPQQLASEARIAEMIANKCAHGHSWEAA